MVATDNVWGSGAFASVGAAPRIAPERVARVHTLGPTGTNCERAAHEWLERHGVLGEVVLHATLEEAVEVVCRDDDTVLLACVVYPALHELVFRNLHRLALVDCFLVDTHNMVFAKRRDVATPASVATHPAPASLSECDGEIRFVSSNARAAAVCARGETDACVTTLPAAEAEGLQVVRDLGPVPMGFTIHAPVEAATT